MTHANLRRHLDPVLRRVRQARFLRRLTVFWLALGAGALAATGLEWLVGVSLGVLVPLFLVAGIGGAVFLALQAQLWTPDLRLLARRVERANPELNSLLLTAVEQRPDPATGQFSFLQLRLIRDAVSAAMHHDWSRAVTSRSLRLWQLGQCGALAFSLLGVWVLHQHRPPASAAGGALAALVRGVEVTPGDVRLEKGSSLVVLVTFGGTVPPDATLVFQTGANTRRVNLSRNLSDPVFGGTIPEVTEDALYRIEYRGEMTADFRVKVYEHPRLERADATIVYPAYTRLPEKSVPDTRRISAVEGSVLGLELLFNKPVRTARLLARDGSVLDLVVATNRAAASVTGHPLVQSRTYELQLVDAEGLTNKVPAQFVLEALPNRPPKTQWLTPRGDQRPSALQEMSFSAEAQDDFGLLGYGFAFELPDGTRREVRLAGTNSAPADPLVAQALPVVAAGGEKRVFGSALALESLGAVPEDLLTWYAWAEDIGPEGLVRRTETDLFFGQVRPFEQIFRQAPTQDRQQQQQQQGAGGNAATKLAELQKQIINATWKLRRESASGRPPEGYATNVAVVLESQRRAREQAAELAENVGDDPARQKAAESMLRHMDTAAEAMEAAEKTPAKLPEALASSNDAYRELVRLSPRETNVTQGEPGSGQGEGGGQQQLDQLRLDRSENRYETRSQAGQQRSPEQQEQSDLLNRLKELAERQGDINERLQELQNALAAAETEEAKEEARRQLKRLQEEQRELLAEADAAQQRAESSAQAERFDQERRQLEQTREDMQRAAESLERGEVSRALSSGSRAERQLEEARDELRRRSSGQFADDLREMRTDARELAEQQRKLTEELSREPAAKRTLSGGPDTARLQEALEQQRSGLTNLLQQMRDMTREAEATEPLLAKELYETLRQHRTGEVEQEFDFARQLIERTFTREAGQLTEKSARSLDALRDGVERAAESVLGDEAETLRLAQKELDDLADVLRSELAGRARGTNTVAAAGPGAREGAPESPGSAEAEAGREGEQPGRSGRTAQAGESSQPSPDGSQPGSSPGQGQSPSESQQPGRAGQQASTSSPGQGQGQGQGQGEGEAASQPGQGRGGGQEQAEARNGGNAPGGRSPGERSERSLAQASQPGGQERGGSGGNQEGSGLGGNGPITGEGYRDFVRRLGDVEEMVGEPRLREEVARVRDRIRGLRSEFRNGAPPQWDMVGETVLTPLLEVRARVAEELAKKQNREAVVPIDRDPVPVRYSEAVRQYYERLGKED